MLRLLQYRQHLWTMVHWQSWLEPYWFRSSVSNASQCGWRYWSCLLGSRKRPAAAWKFDARLWSISHCFAGRVSRFWSYLLEQKREETVSLWRCNAHYIFFPPSPFRADLSFQSDTIIPGIGFQSGNAWWTPGAVPTFLSAVHGFYNLVIMVTSSEGRASECPSTCLDDPGENPLNCPEDCGTVKIPLDFLLYLYPPLYYCRIGCANVESSSSGISTFRDTSGYYGHLQENPATVPALPGTEDKWQYDSPGTGTPLFHTYISETEFVFLSLFWSSRHHLRMPW